jgi:hypothetical protein
MLVLCAGTVLVVLCTFPLRLHLHLADSGTEVCGKYIMAARRTIPRFRRYPSAQQKKAEIKIMHDMPGSVHEIRQYGQTPNINCA